MFVKYLTKLLRHNSEKFAFTAWATGFLKQYSPTVLGPDPLNLLYCYLTPRNQDLH